MQLQPVQRLIVYDSLKYVIMVDVWPLNWMLYSASDISYFCEQIYSNTVWKINAYY